MSGGPRSRFPRTKSSVSQDRLTIEREKIRHRRPDDMRVHEPDDAPEVADSDSPRYWSDDEQYDDSQSPWSDDNEPWPNEEQTPANKAQDWDEGADDEWVFDDPGTDDRDAGLASEDRGVTWEDNDDLRMETSNVHKGDEDEISFGPEVELAGRRDVRPKPPKKPRPGQPKHQQTIDDDQPVSRSQADLGQDDDDFALEGPPPPAPSPARKAKAPQSRGWSPRPRAQAGRAQGSIEIASESPSSVSRMPPLQKNNRPPPSRRRQPQPAMPMPSAKQRSGKRSSPWMMLLMFALAGTGGWLAYQSLDPQGSGALIERWSDSLGISGSGGRTASDTSFGSSAPTDGDLTNSTPAPETTEFLPSTTDPNSQTGGPLSRPDDPVTTATDGPPLPKFKPLDNSPSGSAGAAASSVQVEEPESNNSPANTPEEAAEGPSVMQKIWGNLISN